MTLAHKMKTKITRSIVLTIIAFAMTQCVFAATHFSMPIERVGDQLCLTFPTNGIRWMVTITLDKVYPSQYGQRLCLSNGQQITLADRHITHEITAVIHKDRIGLDITTREDFRSFGGSVTQESYFVAVPRQNEKGQPAGGAYVAPAAGAPSAHP